jgi:hypothetical protein
MQLSKFTPKKTIEIWTPRGHDDMVLINDSQLSKKMPHYRIIFTRNKNREGKQYYLSYKTIKQGKREWHMTRDGRRILRYAVPTSKLQDLIINEKDIRLLI